MHHEVAKIQKKLHEKGYWNSGIYSGTFSNGTFEAVKEFQKKNKLPLTGIVDERTYKMIMA